MKNEPENNRPTRTKRNGTERKKHRVLYSVIIGVLVVILLLLVTSIFSNLGGEDPDTQQAGTSDTSLIVQDKNTDTSEEETDSADSSADTSEAEEPEEEDSTAEEEQAEEEEPEEETEEETEVEPAEPSDDLVTEAYTGDWDPIGTTQEGEHTTNFSNGSQDRIEIKQAVVSVTGLDPNNMIEWWVGNDGPNKVVATVSDRGETEIYRVYLSWVDNEGWQPTKVEELRENDKN